MNDQNTGVLQRWIGDEEVVSIPEGVTTVGKNAFFQNLTLRRVSLPSSLKTIGDGAFEGCGRLEAIDWNPGLRRLGNGCFRGCVSLQALSLPEGVVSIHANAFKGCAGLTKTALPKALRRNIESQTFSGCRSLRSIVLPAGVQQVKRGAFKGCAALERVAFENPDIIIEPTAFDGCPGIGSETRAFIEAHIPSEQTVDINSRASGAAGRLSNYTERHFTLDGVACRSIEGVLQSLKCPDIEEQQRICQTIGGRAKKAGGQYDWKTSQTLYWQGRVYPRRSAEYQDLLDRLYDAVFEQDPAFREDLAQIRECKIDHRMGLANPSETVLTRMEFVRELQRLREKTI